LAPFRRSATLAPADTGRARHARSHTDSKGRPWSVAALVLDLDRERSRRWRRA
jgi:hypothetical protein